VKKIFKGKADKGKAVLYEQKAYEMLLWSLNGKDIEVTVGKPVKKRSNQQNAYFHGVIVPMMSEATGYEIEEMKEIIRAKFLAYEVKVGNDIIKVGRSTASLNTMEFEELNTKCRKWGDEELDIYIPSPNEVEY